MAHLDRLTPYRFYTTDNTFLSNPPLNMSMLQRAWNDVVQSCPDTTLIGTFTEKQDQLRLANYTPDVSLLKSALAFALLSDGVRIRASFRQCVAGCVDRCDVLV
jgi:hypothetical protein